MLAFDTSMVVACFGAWHEHHEAAAALLEQQPRLATHTTLEAYSVLTRLPAPFRAEPAIAAEFLARTFPAPRLHLTPALHDDLPGSFARLGISGGAVYDALIGLTAREAGAELATLDRRAHDTYRRVGVAVRLLGTAIPPPRDET